MQAAFCAPHERQSGFVACGCDGVAHGTTFPDLTLRGGRSKIINVGA